MKLRKDITIIGNQTAIAVVEKQEKNQGECNEKNKAWLCADKKKYFQRA